MRTNKGKLSHHYAVSVKPSIEYIFKSNFFGDKATSAALPDSCRMAEVPSGLTTSIALSRLHEHLDQALQHHLIQNRWQVYRNVVHEAWSYQSQLSVFRWPAALSLTFVAVALITSGLYAGEQIRFSGLVVSGVLLLLVCLLNLSLVLREAHLRQCEMPDLVKRLLDTLKDQIPLTSWGPEHYPHQHCPLSPCISLQWTVRDSTIVNLPVSLLVQGDTVMLRPGQKLPADCVPLGQVESGKLYAGSIYSPPVEGIGGEAMTSPKVRLPNLPQPYMIMETPFVGLLRTVLQEALERPVSVYQKQRNVMAWGMEMVLIPTLALACMGLCIVRFHYGFWCSTGFAGSTWNQDLVLEYELTNIQNNAQYFEDSRPHINTSNIVVNNNNTYIIKTSTRHDDVIVHLPNSTNLPQYQNASLKTSRTTISNIIDADNVVKSETILSIINGSRSIYNSSDINPLLADILETVLVVPACVVLPLLPLVLPLVWTALNTIATAILLTLHSTSHAAVAPERMEARGARGATRRMTNTNSHKKKHNSDGSSRASHDLDGADSVRLCPPDQSSSTEDGSAASDLPKLDAVSWAAVWHHTVRLIRGDVTSCVRGSSILHVLASVTNLCCVDKKGVLSWANPTAEKVFFLRNRTPAAFPGASQPDKSRSNLRSSDISVASDDDVFPNQVHSVGSSIPPPPPPPPPNPNNRTGIHSSSSNNPTNPLLIPHAPNHQHSSRGGGIGGPQSPVESESVLLSLTHRNDTPFRLSFDEPEWKNCLGSLKPLGLSVLLNTCHPDTQAHYTTFCGHLTNEASYTQDLVPVSQRRCLCELSEQIGFSRAAQHPFRLEHQLSVFRHVPAELACGDRLARSLMVSKLKFPFPHMMSVLMRDKATHKLELLTQGTADIVLDSCSDYWDGTDLSPLTEKDRKKLLDFYHRTSLSAYCTAFSYRPSPCVVHADLTKLYMELPTDPSHLYTRSPTPHNSTEALFGDRAHSEYEEVEDIDDLFRMQCKQIFIGMVTMQYQAKKDMVQLIEQLESACVRFVHFSKENELRSRVFSGKMGLESGWNCHISLLDDKAKGEESVSSGSRAGHHSGASLHRTSAEDVMSMGASSRIKNSSFRSKSLKRKLIRGRSLLESSKVLSHSAPSAINLEAPLVKFDDDVSIYSSSSSSNTSSAFGQHHFHYEGSGSELSHHPYPPFHLAAGDDHPRSSPHSPHHPLHQSPIHSLHSYSPHHHHYQHHRSPHHHESHQGHSPQHIGGPTSSPYHPCSTSHSPLVYPSHSPRSQHSARLSSSPAAVPDGALTHSNSPLHHPANSNVANINDTSCQSPSTGGSDFGTAPCGLKHNEDEGDRLDTLTEATVTTTLDAAVTSDKLSCCGDEEDVNQSRLVGCRRDVIDGFKNPHHHHHNNGSRVEMGIHEDSSDVGRRRQLGIRRSGSADEGKHGYRGGLREAGAGLEPLVLEGQHSREASHGTSSSDRSTCFNFDMSNRARLPKGINNIRPHLRDVDNVPLLVSLFTDCTAAATRQMLEIMNENKEVVLITGSSANVDNVSLFGSTDASVGVEPLYPVVCMRVPVMTPPPDGMPSPTGLATRLHTLPCALLFNRHGPLSLVRLIEKSRHLLQCTSNSLQFWAGCSCSLAFLQLLALVALLPPVLHTGDVLWLALVCLPLLSLSLQASPHNPEVMSQATGKNKLVPNSQLFRFVAAHYGSKFLPSLLVVICCAALALRGMCNKQVTTSAMFDDRTIFNDTVEPSSSRNYDNDRRAALGSDAFRTPIIATGGAMYEFNRSSPDELHLDADKHSTLFFSSQNDKIPLVATPTKEGMMFGPKASLSSNTTAVGSGSLPFREVILKPRPLRETPVATFSVAECFYVYQKRHVNSGVPSFLWTGWGPRYAESVRAVQVFTAFLVLLYFCIISISFVHRMGQVWKKNPFVNRVWAVTVPCLLLLQLVYSSLVCSYSAPQGVSSIPPEAWLVALTWGLLLLPVNELLKRREIRANKRYLKKARLEFGTKLGMNSPF